jgi:hypothetical protein
LFLTFLLLPIAFFLAALALDRLGHAFLTFLLLSPAFGLLALTLLLALPLLLHSFLLVGPLPGTFCE